MTQRMLGGPIGFLIDGTPIWPYSGAEGDEDQNGGDSDQNFNEDSETSSRDEDQDDALDEDGLNGKGRRAIEAERKSAERARNSLKPWNALRREFGVTPDQLREILTERARGTAKNEEERETVNVEEVRRQAMREATEKVNERLVRAAVRAEATEFLANPSDATLFLDLSDYEVDDNGEVDANQVRSDLKRLLSDRPYLGKSRRGDGRDGNDPDYDGGVRRTHGRVSMDDLIRRTANNRR